jgi:hypothetical protein
MPALRSLSRDDRGIKFLPLPSAEDEAHSVAKLLGSDCVLRLGREAGEVELKAAVSSRHKQSPLAPWFSIYSALGELLAEALGTLPGGALRSTRPPRRFTW